VARKRDYASLTSIFISPHGGRLDASGKRGDLTDVFLLAPDRSEIAELAPEIADPADRLVADLAVEPVRSGASFFAVCAQRIRQFVAGRAETRNGKKR
jgi:hypothetical protein